MNWGIMVLGFLFGIGFGFFIQRAGLCFAHGLGELYTGRGQRILRLFLVIFIISGLGFFFSKYVHPDLGLKTIGQLRGYGFYNLLSGMIFGAGILLNGGCILGTLRQIGEGNMTFLIVFISFIPGMALIVYLINPLLESGYDIHNVLVPQLLGIPAGYVMGFCIAAGIVWLSLLMRTNKRKR